MEIHWKYDITNGWWELYINDGLSCICSEEGKTEVQAAFREFALVALQHSLASFKTLNK